MDNKKGWRQKPSNAAGGSSSSALPSHASGDRKQQRKRGPNKNSGGGGGMTSGSRRFDVHASGTHKLKTAGDFSRPKRISENTGYKRREHALGFAVIDEIDQKLESRRILPGSSELIKIVQEKHVEFLMRINCLEEWRNIDWQTKILRVLNDTLSASESEFGQLRQSLLLKCLESRLIDYIVDTHISPIAVQPDKRTESYANLVDHFVDFLCTAFEILPTRMDRHLKSVKSLISDLTDDSVQAANFLLPSTTESLERLKLLKNASSERLATKETAPAASHKQRREFVGTLGAPPEDFRLLSIQPTIHDLQAHRQEVYLRAAKKQGRYDDNEHYLDVQFRLMREDLIRPLRDGIAEFRKGGEKKTDLYVYQNVELGKPQLYKQTGDLLVYAKLFMGKRRMRWTKRFMYGGLCCLSSDRFEQNFLFATTIDREKLESGQRVGLQFEETSLAMIENVVGRGNYCMVESPAFFEAYKHVMVALQQYRRGELIPFSRYLVDVETVPERPLYVTNSINLFWNFYTLSNKLERERWQLRELNERFSNADFEMDSSQYEALKYSLESELVVIQGPPGTGKTYIGLRIVRFLLNNDDIWSLRPRFQRQQQLEHVDIGLEPLNMNRLHIDNDYDSRPLLLVCYTNHALDQFLEGIAQFQTSGILRIGGRCKNPNIERFTLPNVRREHARDRNDKEIWRQICQRRDEKRELIEKIDEKTKLMDGLLLGVLPFPPAYASAVREIHTKMMGIDAFLDCRESYMKRPPSIYFWLMKSEEFRDYLNISYQIIRGIMYQGRVLSVTEMEAKRVYFLMYYYSGKLPDSMDFSAEIQWILAFRRKHIKSIDRRRLNDAFVAEWPSLDAIDYLGEKGIPERVAIVLLAECKGNVQRALNSVAFALQQHALVQHVAIGSLEAELPIVDANVEMGVGVWWDDVPDEEDKEEESRWIDDDFHALIKTKKSEKKSRHSFADQSMLQIPSWGNLQINDFVHFIRAAPPMTVDEARQITNFGALPVIHRWRLFRCWIETAKTKLAAEINVLHQKYGDVTKTLDELRSLGDLELMKTSKVVAMTTSGAARHQSALKTLRPQIIVVEEAAEVLEAHLLVSLTQGCEHVILIGDHQQLRPNPVVYELARKYNLEISLFERLINNGYPFRCLRKQHRMRPEISRTLMPHFYPDLEDDESVSLYPDVKGVAKNMFFLNHNHPESAKSDLKSHRNDFEAEFAVRLAKHFLFQEYSADQITILTTYLEQLLAIRKLAQQHLGEQRVRTETVDNYQGEEADIVILSLVRSENKEKKIGYLNIKNRVCVALSRAKQGLFVIGNFDFLCGCCDSGLWSNICNSVRESDFLGPALTIRCLIHEREQLIANAEEFDKFSPEGGCLEQCAIRMDCGHTCPRPCHQWDADHKKMPCTKPCARTCSEGHLCKKLCNQICGICPVPVTKELPCGHVKNKVFCGKNPKDVFCEEPCEKRLSCSHQCAASCGSQCTKKCLKEVNAKLLCGHETIIPCFKRADLASVKCKTKVTKQWLGCEHIVNDVQCSDDVNTLPCMQKCGAILSECQHICKGTCGTCRNGRLHIECEEDCQRYLVCGHKCQEKCSKVCPPCKKPCETACTHSKCNRAPFGEKKLTTRKALDLDKENKNRKGEGGRTCGEPCPPCAEVCLNRCEHRSCSMPCGLPCDVPVCNEPCMKQLPCSLKKLPKGVEGPLGPPHFCIGMCGEECPKICRICNPTRFDGGPDAINETFFGTEDDENARFVQLYDCGHFIEVTAMDHWVAEKSGGQAEQLEGSDEGGTNERRNDDVAIIDIPCPKCKTTIRRSRRYISLLNGRNKDIQQIKTKLRGNSVNQLFKESMLVVEETWPKFKEHYVAKTRSFTFDRILHGSRVIKICETVVNTEPFKYVKKNEWTVHLLSSVRNVSNLTVELGRTFSTVRSHHWHRVNFEDARLVEILKLFDQYFPSLRLASAGDQKTFAQTILANEFVSLFERLSIDNVRTISEKTLDQLSAEIARYNFLIDFFKWFNGFFNSNISQQQQFDAPIAVKCIQSILNGLYGDQQFMGPHKLKMESFLEFLSKQFPVPGFALSRDEMILINRAIGSDVTKWYKCSKGHLYGIGDCGQAMTRARCWECNEIIGGADHRLVANSSSADNMFHEGLRPPPHILDPFNVHY